MKIRLLTRIFTRVLIGIFIAGGLGCRRIERTIEGTVEAFFSAQEGIEWVIEREIDESVRSIDVAVYNFTSRPLAQALVDAHERGVEVRVIMDPSNAASQYSKATYLTDYGIEVRTERGAGLMHHKFALIDDSVLITGSFNWTASAEAEHDENILLLKGFFVTYQRYKQEFNRIWDDARAYSDAQEAAPELSATDISGLRANAGEDVVVHGKVIRIGYSERSNTYFLDFSTEEGLTVVIFSSTAAKFNRLNLSILAYEGAEIEIEGELIDHPEYGLEIVVEEPSQIRLID